MTTTLLCGGRPVPDVGDAIRRYCGLAWSGGCDETWAYRFFDAIVDDDPTHLGAVDVVAAAALHPGLGQPQLAWFWGNRQPIDDWLASVGESASIDAADAGVIDALRALPSWSPPGMLSLLTKVLHRKRPALVPMLDRALAEWYRPVTGARGEAAWEPLVEALRADLTEPGNRSSLVDLGNDLESDLGRTVTPLRIVDIAIWMASR